MSKEVQKLTTQSVDHVTSAIKGLIGAVPIAGPLLAEVAGVIIPNQRMDRLIDYAKKLGERLEAVEESILGSCLTDENFTEAVEESLRQAARSTSEERRSYIASVLANGVESEDIDFIETKHLLRLLGEVNDVEIIWLRWYSMSSRNPNKAAFREMHSEILSTVPTHMKSSLQQRDKAAFQTSYKLHLESLGLVVAKVKFDRSTKIPEFDKKTGFKKSGFEISPLGRLLVRYIGSENTKSDASEQKGAQGVPG